MKKQKLFVCTSCGYKGEPKNEMKGNFAIEIVLWFLMVIPGLIYTVWRMSNKQRICPSCGSNAMIPADSPKGIEMLNKKV